MIFAFGFASVLGYQLFTLRQNLDEFKRAELQSMVQGATSIAQNYYDRFQAGEFSEEEAKSLALESLRGLRYQGNEYVFVDSYGMIMLMHPTKPGKQGSNRAIEQDG
ncbi:MAG: cache domain-containing protein [Candidatus Devosia euplotis]|nr:cache domain-containing protein [Candidatus Devosia euplotis]